MTMTSSSSSSMSRMTWIRVEGVGVLRSFVLICLPFFLASFGSPSFLPSLRGSPFAHFYLPSFRSCFLFSPSFLPSLLLSFLSSFLPSFLPFSWHCFLPSFLPGFSVRSFLSFLLPFFHIPSFLSPGIPSFLHCLRRDPSSKKNDRKKGPKKCPLQPKTRFPYTISSADGIMVSLPLSDLCLSACLPSRLLALSRTPPRT